MRTPELSIIVVSYNVRHLLLDCIKSVIDTCGGINYEIIVVDNTSSDGSVDSVREAFPQVRVIANKDNVGFVRKLWLRSKKNPGGLESAFASFAMLAIINSIIIGSSTPFYQSRWAMFSFSVLIAVGLGYSEEKNGSKTV